jgi:hypothetical protein
VVAPGARACAIVAFHSLESWLPLENGVMSNLSVLVAARRSPCEIEGVARAQLTLVRRGRGIIFLMEGRYD